MSLSYEQRVIFIHIQNSMFIRNKYVIVYVHFFFGQGDMFLQDFNLK